MTQKRRLTAAKAAQLKKAEKLFSDFRLRDAESTIEIEVPQHNVFIVVGILDGVLYTTEREGNIESYIHEFNENSKPILAASEDGKQLAIIEGNYKFTERGIVDQG